MLYNKTASELSKKLISKEISAVELCLESIRRADEMEPRVGAYISRRDEAALQDAKAVDARRAKGEALSPLAGVPVSIKDNICLSGLPMTCSSLMLKDFVSPYDATAVRLLKDAGMTITGKTNLDEFAMGSSCDTARLQTTLNPLDITRSPGGSSGGSAASVAAGEVPVSLGSDTGNSVRCPASYCGLVGFMPAYGAISRYGLTAYASSLDQIGVFAKSAEDVKLMLDELMIADENDATSIGGKPKALTGNVKNLKIGIPKEFLLPGVAGYVKDAVYKAAAFYESLGASVDEISLPSLEYAAAAYLAISRAEASSNLARFDGVRFGYRAKEYGNADELIARSRGEALGDEVKLRILLGTYVLSAGNFDVYYKKACSARILIKNELKAALGKYDLLLAPVMPTIAPKIGEKCSLEEAYTADACTVPANLAGFAALSMPFGLHDGMPVGVQILGGSGSEGTMLDAVLAAEGTGCHD